MGKAFPRKMVLESLYEQPFKEGKGRALRSEECTRGTAIGGNPLWINSWGDKKKKKNSTRGRGE